jgi:hypothetical protein
MNYDAEEVQMFAEAAIAQMGGVCAVADGYDVNSGNITHARNGNDSAMMRRKWKLPKHEPRPRLCIDCPPELIEQFDAARDGRTRAELQRDLLDKWNGVGEVV